MPDEEMAALRRQAKSENLSVGESVRRALREAESRRPTKSAAAKVAAIRKAVQHAFPTGDLGQMNREIERGCQS
jgi:hypothetical protein